METLTSPSKDPTLQQLLARIGSLEAALQQRDALIREQAEALHAAHREITALKQEITDLKNGGPPAKKTAPPDWVKPSTPAAPEEDTPKKRKPRQNAFTWQRREPTETVEHACSTCPDCGRGLSGGWESSRRQILELPALSLRVIDHLFLARHCGVCGKDCVPTGETIEAVGQSHYGPRLVSLVAYLRTVGRLPVQSIQALLAALLGLEISVGQISELLHRVARAGKSTYEAFEKEIQQSAYVNADETGWRENGKNGYIWSFSTPRTRYFVYAKSRSHAVPERVLRNFRGALVSDFYGGYHYYLGRHQRCWVHLLRDVRELKQKYPTPGVLAWAAKLRAIYDRAKAFSASCRQERRLARLGFQAEIVGLGRLYARAGLPQSVLSARLLQFEVELFTFVEYPEVPSENNAAERAVRPRVIARKISGGTRSAQGSATMAVVASLFETWRLRGEEGLAECRKMLLSSPSPALAPASSTLI